MGSARILLDVTNIQRTAHDSPIHGGIWLELDGSGFPDPRWSDFLVPVLSWWVDALILLLDGESTSEEVRFLEGPHAVEIAALRTDAWRVSAVDAGLTRRVRLTSTIEPRPLLASVIAAADTVLAICRARGWEDRESARLESSLAVLRSRGSPQQ